MNRMKWLKFWLIQNKHTTNKFVVVKPDEIHLWLVWWDQTNQTNQTNQHIVQRRKPKRLYFQVENSVHLFALRVILLNRHPSDDQIKASPSNAFVSCIVMLFQRISQRDLICVGSFRVFRRCWDRKYAAGAARTTENPQNTALLVLHRCNVNNFFFFHL